MKKIWFDEAWEDYIYWQTQDKKTLTNSMTRRDGHETNRNFNRTFVVETIGK